MTALDDLKAAVANDVAKQEALLTAFVSVKAGLADAQAQVLAMQSQSDTPELQALSDTLNAEAAKVDAVLAPAPAADAPTA